MKKVAIVCHSGDLDKMYSALIIGTGNLSMGWESAIYFTFWGLERLKKGGLNGGSLSRMNFLGLGRWMMRRRMKKANIASLERLMNDYRELGGKIIACEMTMEVMGIDKSALREDIIDAYGAVGTWWNDAKDSDITLFI
jgi:peroxiredoxin family protein